MFGWLALKSATTLSSTVFCSGASPPPRQQYQRISTGPPGGTVAGPLDGGATDAGAEAPPLLAGVGVTREPPHAVTTIANAAIRAPGRERRDAMCSSSSDPMGSSAGGCGRDGGAFQVGVGLPALADDDA